MIKLIVSDMDGTLLDDEKRIDPEIYELLPKLKEKGIRFVVASGRQYPSLHAHFADHTEDVVLIAENGAFVVDHGVEVMLDSMDKETVHHCIDVISELAGVEVLVCAKYHSYTTNQELYDFLSSEKFQYAMKLVDNLYEIEEDVVKVSVIEHTGMGANECYKVIREKLREDLTLVISGGGCLDTGLQGVHKGKAVQALQELWGIGTDETVVFGDQYNDVEMFGRAHYSFAMEEAEDGVKKHARFRAGSNNKGGVVKAIRELTGL